MGDPGAIALLNEALAGRYRIERTLGEGGMAIVYLAADVRHGRSVALKVLKPEVAAAVGAERFLAEIRTTANLQHPNILPLFDSGNAGSFLYYVMPWVEGESLRERLRREHQLPVDEAVRIAIDLAEALQYAHGHGVVHRDVKPENILLQSGRPVIADFGIALAIGAAGGGRLTETGMSVGTPHYMSPEQAAGDESLGPGTDVYALGCVLYEMLVGEPPHTGSTPQAVLGRIIAATPDPVTEHRRATPSNVDAAVARALEKLPADRFTDANAFARALQDPGYRNQTRAAAAGVALGPWRWLAGVGALSTAALFGVVWMVTRPEPVTPPDLFPDPFLPGQEPAPGPFPAALSPDGSRLVYRGPDERLWLRRWDRLDATPLPVGGGIPGFSPDGGSILHVADGGIRVHVLESGATRTVARAGTVPRWTTDGRIYFMREGALVSVAPDGSDERTHTTPEDGKQHFMADVLPDDRTALIVVRDVRDQSLEVHTLDLDNGDHEFLVLAVDAVSIAPGVLVYGVQTDPGVRVVASRVDLRTWALGDATTLADSVAFFTVAADRLLYAPAGSRQAPARNLVELAWVDTLGEVSVVGSVPPFQVGPLGANRYALSPDGSRVSVRVVTEEGFDVWVFDLVTGAQTRLTSHPGMDQLPAWHPSGTRVSFLSDRGGNDDVWIRTVNATSEPELLLDLESDVQAAGWAPDGTLLLGIGGDLLTYRPDVDDEPRTLLATPFQELQAEVSPDGRWLAYSSNESGRLEVYLRPYPDVDRDRHQISVTGGRSPKWSPDGRLFFRSADHAVMAVGGDSAGPPFTGESPARLFEAAAPWATRDFDVAPDATRFLLARLTSGSTDAPEGPQFVLITGLRRFLAALPPP